MLQQYERDQVFLPKVLKKGLPTIVPKDNLDLNSSFNTASRKYHVTMSVLQFPSLSNPGVAQEFSDETVTHNTTSMKVETQSSLYTYVKRLLSANKDLFVNSSLEKTLQPVREEYKKAVAEEQEWLQNVTKSKPESSLWARYHFSKKRAEVRMCGIQAILPLLQDPVHTHNITPWT